MSKNSGLHVAVAIIKNSSEDVLISRRAEDVHQGGLWEFPGGKVEAGETLQQALARECREELGISVTAMSPLIQIRHHYPEKDVFLDVWEIQHFSGKPMGCEGQPLRWVGSDDLNTFTFPEANLPIITAVQLPQHYAILNGHEVPQLRIQLEMILDRGIKLIQLRTKSLVVSDIGELLAYAVPLCRKAGARLLLNSAVENAFQHELEGIHLTSEELMKRCSRPSDYAWVAASCHSHEELAHAQKIGVDFAVLAPVMPTPTHPDADPLGWPRFKEMVSAVNIPVFALGGMSLGDTSRARAAGGQGIAGISMFAQCCQGQVIHRG